MSLRFGKEVQFRTPANGNVGIITDDTYRFAFMDDNTDLYKNGVIFASGKSRYDTDTYTLNDGDIISSNNAISMTDESAGLQGLFYNWAGRRFGFRNNRYTIDTYVRAVDKTASVKVYQSGTLISTTTVTSDSVVALDTRTVGGVYNIESDQDIVAYSGQLPSSDCKPLYPANKKIYGTGSSTGYIIYHEDNTTVTVYHADGTTNSFTGNKGEYDTWSDSSQFSGHGSVVVADKPVSGHSYADSDGAEMTPFVAKESFGQRFIIPEDENEFVQFVSDKPATLNFYTGGVLVSTVDLAGNSHGGGIYDYYANTGSLMVQNTYIESSDPVCAIVEGNGNDEQVLMGSWLNEEKSTLKQHAERTAFYNISFGP